MEYLLLILSTIYVHRLGFIQLVADKILSVIFRRPVKADKPFSCLLCTTFWVSFVYLIVSAPFIKALSISLLAAFLSQHISNLIGLIDKILNNILLKIWTLLN